MHIAFREGERMRHAGEGGGGACAGPVSERAGMDAPDVNVVGEADEGVLAGWGNVPVLRIPGWVGHALAV